MLAAGSGHNGVITLLLKLGADPNQMKLHNGCTSLMSASFNGHIDTSRLLFAAGADPNTRKTYSGWTAAMYAAAQNGAMTLTLYFAVNSQPAFSRCPQYQHRFFARSASRCGMTRVIAVRCCVQNQASSRRFSCLPRLAPTSAPGLRLAPTSAPDLPSAARCLSILPDDLWFTVLGMILRRWWSAPRATTCPPYPTQT